MDREIHCGTVDKPDDCFTIFFHSKGGPRANTIIAHKLGFLESRVDLLLKGLDFNLIIVDILASGRVVV